MTADDPTELFGRAVQAHQAGRLAQAESAYRAILASHPRHFPSLTNLGLLQLGCGNHDEALRLLSLSLNVDQNQPQALANRGALLFHFGRHAEAVSDLDRAIALRPEDPTAHSNRGLALNALKRFSEALASCDRALALRPDHAEALNNRGTALSHLGRHDEALASYERAIALRPDNAETHNNRGAALLYLGRNDEALASFERAIALRPDYAEAHGNRANALRDLRRPDVALASLDAAIALEPRSARLHNVRGNVLRDLQRLDEARASYERALALQPDLAEAHNNLGNVLMDLGRPDAALASYNRALELAPSFAAALINRGGILEGEDRHEEALASLDAAIALDPRNTSLHNVRGNILRTLRRFPEARAAYENAIALQPDLADAHGNLGNVLLDLGHADAALLSFDRAIALQPDNADTHHNRGLALAELQRFEEALADFNRAVSVNPDLESLTGNRLHARMHLCDWPGIEAEWARLLEGIDRGRPAGAPFQLLAIPSSPAQQRRAAELFAAGHAPAPGAPLEPARLARHDRIRLGYFSADLREHAQAYLLAELIERHDRARFEVFAYAYGPDTGDAMRRRLESAFDRYVDVRALSDQDAAARAREHALDIAIDLTGYTAHFRTGIFRYRPAPVQVNYLGYPGTLGAPYMDYIVADRVVIPEVQFPHYSEKVVWLPHSYQPNDSTRPIADRTFTRAELGLPGQGFVFCCFNGSYKLTPDVFDVWMRLLREVEGSVLWLLEHSATCTENLRREAARRGVAPGRLVFAPKMELPAHLARHRLADLFLDTYYVGAHTTASDALWAGLPLLTCPGETFASRVAASLLTAIGLPELIAPSRRDYEARALDLATHPERLAAIRRKLAANRGTAPLFDTAAFARGLEAAYGRMAERSRNGLRPEHFAVPAE